MLFVSHHKCASTLASRYIIQFAKANGLTYFGSARGDKLIPPDRDVAFLGNGSYPFLSRKYAGRGVHIIRNPLNVVQSAYYSHLRTHNIGNLPILAAQRAVLEKCTPDEGKMLTLAFCERNDFFPGTPGPLCALRQWDYDDERFVTIRMEDFGDRIDLALAAATGEEGAAMTWPDPQDFTFRAMSGGREVGTIDESSAYRSGHPDAWRSELPAPIVAYVRAHFAVLLERFYPEALTD